MAQQQAQQQGAPPGLQDFTQQPVPTPPAPQQQQFQQPNAKRSAAAGIVSGGRRIPTKDYNPKLPVCAVIVTIHSGDSYDELFTRVKQSSPDPTACVSVFSFQYGDLKAIHAALGKKDEEVEEKAAVGAVLKELQADIDQLRDDHPEAVVFNFECCSCCSSEQGFGQGRSSSLELVRWALDSGMMVTFGDFSVKALIRDWNEKLLGPNPFVQIGTFSNSFELRFDPQALVACPSAQLQRVGELCEEGKAVVKALPGTVSFTVDPSAADTSAYQLDVLTVTTKQNRAPVRLQADSPHRLASINSGGRQHKGAVGHVLLTYPSGGRLLASSGHWIELASLDVSQASVLQAASKKYGKAFAKNMSAQLASSPAPRRQQVMQAFAQEYVQSSTPSFYSPVRKKG